jgi:serine protease AprX
MQQAPSRLRWRIARQGAVIPLVAAALLAAAPGADARSPLEPVVVLERPGSGDAAEAAVRALGGSVQRQLPLVGGFSARLAAGSAGELRRSAGVKSVSPDRRMKLLADTAVPAATDAGASLAGVRSAIAAGSAPLQGAGVDVALVDSGVAPVPALQGHVVNGADFSPDAQDATKRYLDGFGHGTHLAGIVAADDGAGLSGVAPAARVVNVKVADQNGATSLSQVLAGIDWAVRNARRDGRNIRVLNLSIGAEPQSSYRDDPLAFAVERAWKSGIAVVTAAGNGGTEAGGLDSPAYDPYVIAVAAGDTMGTADPADDRVPDFSSRGAERLPDVVAPGVDIVSTRVPGGLLDQMFPAARIGESYFRGSGTSQAAAVASAAAALLIAERPGLRADDVKALLRTTARPLADPAEAAGSGQIAVDQATAAEPPKNSHQSFPPATGRGTWRGSLALEVVESGNLNATRWRATRWRGDGWTATRWRSDAWTATRWRSDAWTATRWRGTSWSTAGWNGAPTS